MAAIFPPDHMHGKQLKMWYREKMRRFTGSMDLPEGWQYRVGLEVFTSIRTVKFDPFQYEKWDMSYELLLYICTCPNCKWEFPE